MKCEKCGKLATYHITDINHGKPREYHFCDAHAREHLASSTEPSEPGPPLSMGKLAKKLSTGGGREASAIDNRQCPSCQITFLEFRNSGRLGCPHDYEVFRDELMPLLENIHEETRHSGKAPRRAPLNTQRHSALMKLRNDLKRAIAAEDYEAAARLRDQIKTIEHEQAR